MFDLYLLNSQNMAVSLKYDNLKFTKNEEESVEKLEDYNKQFLQPTKNLLSKKLESYQKIIEDTFSNKNSDPDVLDSFQKAANRYSDLRNLGEMKIKELIKTEREQLLNSRVFNGLGKFLKSNFSSSKTFNKYQKKNSVSSIGGGIERSVFDKNGTIERVDEEEGEYNENDNENKEVRDKLLIQQEKKKVGSRTFDLLRKMTQNKKNKKSLNIPILSENESNSIPSDDNDDNGDDNSSRKFNKTTKIKKKPPLGYKNDDNQEPLETEERGLLFDIPVEYSNGGKDEEYINTSPINVRVKFPRPGTKSSFSDLLKPQKRKDNKDKDKLSGIMEDKSKTFFDSMLTPKDK